MDNQIELNKFYLVYNNGAATIIYPYEYYQKGRRIRYHRLFLTTFVYELVGIEEHNYVDINSEESIKDFIWCCPYREQEWTVLTRGLNYLLFSSDSIRVYESSSAVDFVRFIRDNFNHNTVADLDRRYFEVKKPDCDAKQQKN